ncbi:MAG: hypothetical protein ACRELY_10495 [Polyangiaceae bacterium]
MKRARWKWRSLATLIPLAWGCSLITSLDGLTGGGASDDAGVEGGTDAQILDAGFDSGDSGGNPLTPRAWHQVSDGGPPARHSARMVYDEARQVSVLFGGSGPYVASDDETWEWNGVSWSQPTVNQDAPGGKAFGMAYDTDDHVTLLFGGTSGSNSMWQWSGGPDWQSPGPTGDPPLVNWVTAMTYDSARHVAVLYSGAQQDGAGLLHDVWEWNASSGWVERNLSVLPQPRAGQALVYDSARSRVVLFGGYDPSVDHVTADLWEYDGTTWTESNAAQPPARLAPCAAYDAYRRVTVIFGGRTDDESTSLADTWEWDGTTWRPGPAGPPARRTCGMAYDAARNEIVMFGGSPGRHNDTSDALGDTWIYQ